MRRAVVHIIIAASCSGCVETLAHNVRITGEIESGRTNEPCHLTLDPSYGPPEGRAVVDRFSEKFIVPAHKSAFAATVTCGEKASHTVLISEKDFRGYTYDMGKLAR
jgi:hypothetical protein